MDFSSILRLRGGSDDFAFVVTSGFVLASLLVGYLMLKMIWTGKTLPMASTSILQAFHGIGGANAPFFILGLSKKMKTLNFRLPVPASLQGVFVIGDPKLAKEILTDETTGKPRALYKAMDVAFCGIKTLFLQPNNDYTKGIRKSTSHAFSKNEVGRMNEIALKHVNRWLEERSNLDATFDPAHEMTRITFLSICEAAFEYEATEEEFAEFAHVLEVSLRESTKQVSNPLRGTFIGNFIPSVREAHRCAAKSMEFARRVLEAYRKNPNKSKQNTLIKLIEGADVLANNDAEKVSNTHVLGCGTWIRQATLFKTPWYSWPNTKWSKITYAGN